MVFNFSFGYAQVVSCAITELGQGKELFMDEAFRVFQSRSLGLERHVSVLSQCTHRAGALHLLPELD